MHACYHDRKWTLREVGQSHLFHILTLALHIDTKTSQCDLSDLFNITTCLFLATCFMLEHPTCSQGTAVASFIASRSRSEQPGGVPRRSYRQRESDLEYVRARIRPELTGAHRAVRSPSVRITIGEANEDYDAPKALLCHYSSYFRNVLEGGFEEAKSLKFEFEEEDPCILDIFLYW